MKYSDGPLDDRSFRLKKDNPMVCWLKKSEGILMREFRTTVEYKAMWEAEKKQLRDQKIEACIGLKDDEGSGGCTSFGRKEGT